MKKFSIVLVTLLGSLSLFSCTPEDIAEDTNDEIITEEVAGGRRFNVRAINDD